MPIPIRPGCLLLLALPVAALADPVAVTTQSAGTMRADSAVMNVLGLNPETSDEPLPYELRLRSTFDPATMPSPESFWAYSAGDVVIDFRIGSQVYHYAGEADSSAHLYAQSASVEEYGHHIGFEQPNLNFGFRHLLLGPPGSMGIFNPLAPLHADESDGLTGDLAIYMYLTGRGEYLAFSMEGVLSTMSVHVAVVPEPAPFVLLAAGLLTLGLRRRLGLRLTPLVEGDRGIEPPPDS